MGNYSLNPFHNYFNKNTNNNQRDININNNISNNNKINNNLNNLIDNTDINYKNSAKKKTLNSIQNLLISLKKNLVDIKLVRLPLIIC